MCVPLMSQGATRRMGCYLKCIQLEKERTETEPDNCFPDACIYVQRVPLNQPLFSRASHSVTIATLLNILIQPNS